MRSMNRTEPAVVETVTGPGTLDEIHDALDVMWLTHTGVPEEVRMRMAIAAAEIGANIIEHAGRGHSIPMRMEARVLPHAYSPWLLSKKPLQAGFWRKYGSMSAQSKPISWLLGNTGNSSVDAWVSTPAIAFCSS